MIRTGNPTRGKIVSQLALGVALAMGMVTAATLAPSPAMAAKKKKDSTPKREFSKGFIAAAGPAQAAIEAAKTREDVVAAKAQIDAALQSRDEQRIAAAQSAVNAAIANEKALVDGAFAAVEGPDDRFMAGSLAYTLGAASGDTNLLRRGVKEMIASNTGTPEEMQRFNAAAGQLAYQAGDYPEAAQYLKAAVDSGYTQSNIEVLLAEAYIASGNTRAGLGVLKQAIDGRSSAGSKADESWYRRGLSTAYKTQSIGDTTDFAVRLVRDYPKNENWGIVSTFLRELGSFGSQETLDLMRLMGRTKSYVEPRDYIEYIQAADPRRLPGEALDVINAGIASGMLKASDTSIADWKTQASGRVADDRASLASYARDARKAGAVTGTVTGAADALLSYGQSAEAEELYKMALGMPGADVPEVMTRLGIAQVDQGNYAAAQESFGKVTGKRQPIARVWAAYAAHKANSAPAPVASATAPASTE